MADAETRPLTANLHALALTSPDPAALGEFYEQAMGLALTRFVGGVLGAGPARKLFFVEGAAKRLAFAAYSVASDDELDQLGARLRHAGTPPKPFDDPAELFMPGAVAIADPDGNLFAFGVPAPDLGAASAGSDAPPARLQHCVVASRDPARLSLFYRSALGFALSDNVIDEAGGLRAAFLRSDHEHHSLAVFRAPKDRFDHHCYETENWNLIRDWGDRFAGAEIPVVWGPGRHGPGNNLFLFVHDRDGNWLEISAELESVPEGRPARTWPHTQRTLNSWGSAPLRS